MTFRGAAGIVTLIAGLRQLWPSVGQVDEQDQLFRLPVPADAPHVALRHDAQVGEIRADRLGNVGRRQVRVVPLGHARVSVPKLRCNDGHRYTLHGKRAAVGVLRAWELY